MRRILFILFALAIPVLLLAAEPVREWKTKSGKTISATFDAANDPDPETVYLLKEGKRFKIPFEKLSKTDQDYVNKVRKNARSLDDDEFEEVSDVDARGIEIVPAGKRYALLIGVNEYAKPIKSLKYCVKDMELLSECFQKLGVPKENIFLVTDDSPAERRPTGSNIRYQIENITSLMDSGDQLFIAFSGHGAMVDGKSYLCPSDTDLDNKNSVISRDWVFDKLEKCKAKQKIFFIDACRNEIAFNGLKALGNAKALEDPVGADTHGFILIASCSKSQYSWEHPEIHHGVFTYFLGKGLSGDAADEQGYVSIMNLFQYASSKTKSYVFREFNKIQVPTFGLRDAEGTDFCIGKLKSVEGNASTASVEPTPAVQSSSTQLKAGDRDVKIINGVEFAFRWCPAGTFTMGSPSDESGRSSDETQHEVTLTKGFWMMETEVTQRQWKAVMGNNPSCFKGDDLPVEHVSWGDCQDFCKKCTQLGLPVQLPTEAQWEYACRAGTTGAYAGNLDEMAWYGYYETPKGTSKEATTHPVGKKKPNAWGLYDMHGNVYEWCQDWEGDYPSGSVTDPTGPTDGSYRVDRGGSWGNNAGGCRSARRGYYDPVGRDFGLGVRFSMSITSPEN